MQLDSPTLASLRFFEAAARLLSFKHAAHELCVTQGAVSQQIKHLETALGCQLFYRHPRQIELTAEGRRFAVVVERALGDIKREAKAIVSARSQHDVRVRVGPSFALRWLVPRLGSFYSRHPNIRLTIAAGYGYFDPARREFDLAIDTGVGEPLGMHAEMLMEEFLTPVCSPRYLNSHPLNAPSDLSQCTLLHDAHAWSGADRDAEWQHWLQSADAGDVDSAQGTFFTLAYMSLEAAVADQGVALGRGALLGDLVRTAQLIQPFHLKVKSQVKYWILCPPELADRPDIAALRQWLHEEAAKMMVEM